jgi:phospholipase D1/2
VPEVDLPRIKDRLSQVRGSVVECPLVGFFLSWREIGAHMSPQDFLIDDKEFVEGIDWLGLNPTLPIYI